MFPWTDSRDRQRRQTGSYYWLFSCSRDNRRRLVPNLRVRYADEYSNWRKSTKLLIYVSQPLLTSRNNTQINDTTHTSYMRTHPHMYLIARLDAVLKMRLLKTKNKKLFFIVKSCCYRFGWSILLPCFISRVLLKLLLTLDFVKKSHILTNY